MASLVSKVHAEVLTTRASYAQASKVHGEVLMHYVNRYARVSKVHAEVLAYPKSFAFVSKVHAEILVGSAARRRRRPIYLTVD